MIARAGGNPLFVEELATAVREAGGGRVPATARDVIAARVDRLPPAAKTVLQFAAVAGDGVRVRILEELVGAGDLAAELEELCRRGALAAGRPRRARRRRGRARLRARPGPRGGLRLAVTARPPRRPRAGRPALASRFHRAATSRPRSIAEHLERGGDGAGAAAFWLRAARLAAASRDCEGALALWDRVLLLERRLGADPPTAASEARRAEARAGLDRQASKRPDPPTG